MEKRCRQLISRLRAGAALGDPAKLTYFEFGTLAAMQCFIEHKVDVAILEVGLGGRLDAVNVFDSDCAVVTSVDIDHTDYLGETREQIAFERRGFSAAARWRFARMRMMPQAIATMPTKIGAELWRINLAKRLFPPAGGRGLAVTVIAHLFPVLALSPPQPPPSGESSSGITAASWVRAMRCRIRRCAARSSCITPARRWRRWMR